MLCTFITHPEVIIDPSVPIEEWGLSTEGGERARLLPALFPSVCRVISSAERKARDTAEVFKHAAFDVELSVDAELGEMDRSATGYLAPDGFELIVDAPYEGTPR